jgi:hypothetical protein
MWRPDVSTCLSQVTTGAGPAGAQPLPAAGSSPSVVPWSAGPGPPSTLAPRRATGPPPSFLRAPAAPAVARRRQAAGDTSSAGPGPRSRRARGRGTSSSRGQGIRPGPILSRRGFPQPPSPGPARPAGDREPDRPSPPHQIAKSVAPPIQRPGTESSPPASSFPPSVPLRRAGSVARRGAARRGGGRRRRPQRPTVQGPRFRVTLARAGLSVSVAAPTILQSPLQWMEVGQDGVACLVRSRSGRRARGTCRLEFGLVVMAAPRETEIRPA